MSFLPAVVSKCTAHHCEIQLHRPRPDIRSPVDHAVNELALVIFASLRFCRSSLDAANGLSDRVDNLRHVWSQEPKVFGPFYFCESYMIPSITNGFILHSPTNKQTSRSYLFLCFVTLDSRSETTLRNPSHLTAKLACLSELTALQSRWSREPAD